MVHAGIFASSSEILTKCGENYDTGVTEAKINELCLQAESRINCECHYNFSDGYAALNADVKGLLSDAESCLVASYIPLFNCAGYSYGLKEAQSIIDLLMYQYNACIKLLKEQLTKDFMIGA
jgi:hypothetical protein